TRFLPYLPLEPKEYVAAFRFGIETESDDTEGDTVAEAEVPADLSARIAAALPQFRGEIDQLPPLYSAVKKDGRKLYEYARKGQEVERELRRVTVHEFEEVPGGEGADRSFRIVCGGGTYVRSLARDLGRAVGCGAHVTAITRTRVGEFTLAQADVIAEMGPDRIVPLARAIGEMKRIVLNEGQVAGVRQGRPAKTRERFQEEFVALQDEEGEILGIGEADGPWVHPKVVFPAE
ncbi:MAG: tRNA pseudouridine(55) synthase TruB, partial [Fimbriimonadaceae bacterium]|nr:tRNA pseudouridine(55) synthase TruB [Fimbriimonadaceae bacterium]